MTYTLEEIKEMLAKLSPWPWQQCDYHWGIQDKNGDQIAVWAEGHYVETNPNYRSTEDCAHLERIDRDWNFAINAPQIISDLVNQLEEKQSIKPLV